MPDLLPVDTNVRLPASVLKAAEAATQAHQAAYKENIPQPDQPQPVPIEPSRPEDRAGVDPASWEGRFYAMEGRYRQSQASMGMLQEQLTELGDELVRTQQMLRAPQRQQAAPLPQPTQRLVTDQDVQTYGPELIDVVKRAAREAVSPDLQTLATQNQKVTQQVTRQNTQSLYGSLDTHVPTWREINVNPRFKA